MHVDNSARPGSPGGGRRRRGARGRLALILATLAALCAGIGPALAVGTDGVEIEIDLPPGADGRPEVVVGDEPVVIDIVLRNIVEEERSVRVYVVGATVDESGRGALGQADDASYVRFEDQEVTVPADTMLRLEATILPLQLPKDEAQRRQIAFVLQSTAQGTVLPQAATIVHVVGERPRLPGLLLVGVALLIAGLLAVIARLRADREAEANAT